MVGRHISIVGHLVRANSLCGIFFFFFSVPQGAVENLKRSGEQDLTYLTLNTFRKDSCGRTRVEGDRLFRRLLYSYPSERC